MRAPIQPRTVNDTTITRANDIHRRFISILVSERLLASVRFALHRVIHSFVILGCTAIQPSRSAAAGSSTTARPSAAAFAENRQSTASSASALSWQSVRKEPGIWIRGEIASVKQRFTEAQIIGFLREAEAGLPVKDLCRRHGFSEASYYLWRSKFGVLSVSDAKRLKELETENGRLKKLLAESQLEIEVTREVLQKNGDRTGSTRGGAGDGRAGPQRAQGPDRGADGRVGLPVRAKARW